MAHKVFISFKAEDIAFKTAIQEMPNLDFIDKSLNESINSSSEDYILQKIRADYLSDSTVTIFLIGSRSNEYLGESEQKFIKRELQGSLYSSQTNSKNGILGIVLPSMTTNVYKGSQNCLTCGNPHSVVVIDDSTVIREFSYNYYLPNSKCSWDEDDRYCVLVTWSEFRNSPETYIDQAFNKRFEPIERKTKVRPTSAGS